MTIMASKGEIVNKPSGLITLRNTLTKNEHKLYNGILKMTLENLKDNPKGRIKTTYGVIMKLTGLTHQDHVKTAMRGLMKNQIEFKDYLLKDGQTHWGGLEANFLAHWKWWRDEQLVEFQIPDAVLEILRDNSMYARLNMQSIAKLQNKHALWLYEILVDYKGIGSITYTLEQIRDLAGLTEKQYPQTKALKRNVIDKAVKEVSDKTPFKVSIEAQTIGRKVTGYTFRIKDTTSEIMKSEKLFREYVVDLFMRSDYTMSIKKDRNREAKITIGFKENASGSVLMYDMEANRPLPKEVAMDAFKRLYEARYDRFWEMISQDIKGLLPTLDDELENFSVRKEAYDLF